MARVGDRVRLRPQSDLRELFGEAAELAGVIDEVFTIPGEDAPRLSISFSEPAPFIAYMIPADEVDVVEAREFVLSPSIR